MDGDVFNLASDVESDQPTRRGPKPQPREFVATELTIFRMTPFERARVELAAKVAGVTLSEFCRDYVLEAAETHLKSES